MTAAMSEHSFTCVAKSWKKNSTLRLKRVNSIAQDEDYLTAHFKSLGYAPTGSYVKYAAWGQQDTQNSVQLLTGSSTQTWEPAQTHKQGGFPGSPQVTCITENSYFYEHDIMLRTQAP